MKVIDVAAGLVFRAGKLLITQRLEGTHLAGLWEFPGGKREANETFEECLARELHEELGITVAVGQQVETIVHSYPEKTVRLEFFRCTWTAGEPQTLGCSAIAWVTMAQLDNYQFPAADARLLERLRTERSWWAGH